MDCKTLEQYASKVAGSEGEKVIIDKFFFVALVKELIKRRRMLGQRDRQRKEKDFKIQGR